MKDEFERMRNDAAGCTDKCKLRNKLAEAEAERSKPLIRALMQFEWCSECSKLESGAVQSPCKAGCGKRLMAQCVPLMQGFSKHQEVIDQLKAALSRMEQREMTFKEFQSKQKELAELEKDISSNSALAGIARAFQSVGKQKS